MIPPPQSRLAGLILAAGASSRMGAPKALLPIGGETFLDRLIALLLPVCHPVVVVLGVHRAPIATGIARGHDVLLIENPDPDRGMMSSLQCGLRALPSASGVLFTLVDCPAILPSTIEAVVHHFFSQSLAVAVPEFNGRRGHPVCIAPPVAADLLAAPLTTQPRDIIQLHRTPASILPVDDPGIVADADHPEDYAAVAALGLRHTEPPA